MAIGIIAWFLLADTDGAPEITDTEEIEQVEPVDPEENTVGNGTSDDEYRAAILEKAKAEIMANPDAKLNEFVEFIGDESQMGIDHNYTNEAMTKLVNATIERAIVTDVDINTELRSVMKKAEAITNDPMDGDHADKMKQAYLSLTDVIEKVQVEKYPELSGGVEEIRDAAQSIDPATLALNQKEKINGYFEKAADVLLKMKSES